MGFHGRAVYMDVDMLVLGDVAELLLVPLPRPWVCCHPAITDVSVIDCGAFRDLRDRDLWPTIEQMQRSGWKVFHYCQLLGKLAAVSDTLSWDWNCRDSNCEWTKSTKLLHFTSVPHQPWKPYDTVNYKTHPKLSWERKWREEFANAASF